MTPTKAHHEQAEREIRDKYGSFDNDEEWNIRKWDNSYLASIISERAKYIALSEENAEAVRYIEMLFAASPAAHLDPSGNPTWKIKTPIQKLRYVVGCLDEEVKDQKAKQESLVQENAAHKARLLELVREARHTMWPVNRDRQRDALNKLQEEIEKI